MRVDNNELTMTLSLREAQSLLVTLRRVNSERGRSVRVGMPHGMQDDMTSLQSQLEQTLLLDPAYGIQ